MPITFNKVLEKVVAMMGKSAPRNLSKCLRAVLDVEECDPDLFGVKDLEKAMKSADHEATLTFGRALTNWDHVEEADWTGDAPPHTDARRARIYDLLALPDKVREACSIRIPVEHLNTPTVIAEQHEPWDPPADQFYWDAYERQLRTVHKWPQDSIIALDDSTRSIVERFSDPTRPEAYQSRGLVIGYVQSGKTANFTGVIARAVDAGYRLIIVLGGVLDILRNQTQRRLDKDLVGKELLTERGECEYEGDSDWEAFVEHGALPSAQGSFDWQRLTGAQADYASLARGLDALEFERVNKKLPFYARENLAAAKARLVVIKKHPTVMKRLITDLRKLRSKLADVPTLIIDDESDQASVNTVKPDAADTRVRTATNLQITQLLKELKRAQYVGYTATPFANCFVDPSDVDDIFPKDFMIPLDRPAHYMGVSDFYDTEGEEPPPGYSSNERAYVRSIRGDDDAPENLRKAIDSFVLSGAIKLFREKKGLGRFRHHTMLVHRSQKRKAHAEDADLVRHVFDHSGFDTKAGRNRLENLFDKDFKPVWKAKEPSLAMPASFSELEKSVGECLAKLAADKTVRVVNGDHLDDTPDFDKQGVWSILVGGTKLSRGYTVEGLTVSYYRRTASAADTLMQMGRWFGFRRNYRDLVRLFIGRDEVVGRDRGKEEQAPRKKSGSTKHKEDEAASPGTGIDLYEHFRAICKDEEEFRKELRMYARLKDPRITPRMIPPLIPSHLLRPTAPNKMYNAKVVSENFGGRWCDKTSAPTKAPAIRANAKAMRDMLAGVTVGQERLVVDVEGKPCDFEANLAVLDPASVLTFLQAYRWSGDNQELLARQLGFLRGDHGDAQIRTWLLIAPKLEAGEMWQAHGTSYSVRHRARVGPDGDRYNVYTEPAHKDVAEYLAGTKEGAHASKRTAALVDARRAIMLFYPTVDKDKGWSEANVNMGFSLLFPKNNIPTPIMFGVHDPRNEMAITVKKSR